MSDVAVVARVETRTAALGRRPPATTASLTNLGIALGRLERWDDALEANRSPRGPSPVAWTSRMLDDDATIRNAVARHLDHEDWVWRSGRTRAGAPCELLPCGRMDDWELLEAWRAGDGAAGEALVGRYLEWLNRFFVNKVSNPEDVAELISETMLACTRGKETLRDSTAFGSFLFGAATNTLRRYYTKKVKRSRELDDFADICVGDAENPRSFASMLAMEQEARLLARALRKIPLDQQIVLELSYIEDLKGPEIAELLGVPQATVYTRLRRGKDKLRAVVAELASSPELADSTMDSLRTWATKVREKIEP